MTAGTVLLWRHGQTDYNSTGRLQGQVDIELNELGRSQAEMAAAVLAKVRPARIVSSDLRRAHATAEALARHCDADVLVDQRLRERSFGDWEGLTHPEIEAGWPDAYVAWSAGHHPEGVGAETRRETGQRVATSVTETTAPLEDSDTVVFVTHGAAISAGLTTLIGLDPEEWRGITGIGNCHWSVLRANIGQEPDWRLTAHNVGVPDADFARAVRIA